MALNKIDKLNSQVSRSKGKITVIRPTENLSEQVEVVGNQLVLNNTIKPPVPKVTFYSSKLLNYVEPFPISGSIKTAFYSELSTNIQVGDRVFIFNGFYDSDDYLKRDKYTKYTDGYRVLAIDGCKIVLDIDYTGQLPFTDFSIEDLIFVHNITSQERFIYANSMNIALDIPGAGVTKLSDKLYSSFFARSVKGGHTLYGGNIIYVGPNLTFTAFDLGVSKSNPISTSTTTGAFCAKLSVDKQWTSVTTSFKRNRFRVFDKKTNPLNKFGNKKIFIIGEDFTFEGFVFKERCVYKYIDGAWVFDKSYKQPIISKNNFRGGDFKGVHNDGIFGCYDIENIWEDAEWNSGVFVNSRWKSGQMRSKSKKGDLNYVARLDLDSNGNRIALQNTDTSDNKGSGYNYIVDSVILRSTIRNGTFENSNIGLSNWNTSAIENYYSKSATFSVSIGGGDFSFCDIWSTSINFARVNDSILNNSLVRQSNSVSNQLIDSVADVVNYSSEGGLQVLGADLYSYYLFQNKDVTKTFDDIRGVLKIFISDKDFLRMEKGDSFYLEKINKDFFLSSLDSNDRILLPIEARYLLDLYTDVENTGPGLISSVTLKGRVENRNKYYVELEQEILYGTFYLPDVNSDSQVWEVLTSLPDTIPVFDTTETVQLNYPNGQFVRYVDGGVNGVYEYLGDPSATPPNVPTGALSSPLATDDNGNSFWNFKGIFIGDWPLLADEEFVNGIIEGDIYRLPLGDWVYRTDVNPQDRGAGYQTNEIPIGFDNKRKMTVVPSSFDACSIDIDSIYFGYYVDSFGIKRSANVDPTGSVDQIGERGLRSLPLNNINECFVNTYIKPADFRSGLMTDSIWYNGYNINYFNNIIRTKSDTTLDINFDSKNRLTVNVNNTPYDSNYNKPGFDISPNDYVWLNGVYYSPPNIGNRVDLSGRYQVISVLENSTFITYKVESREKSFDSLLDTNGRFIVLGAEDANYITLSKMHIQKTNIYGGLFRRTSLKDLTIYNSQFNNQDLNFTPSNMNLLRLINIVYSNNNLTINSGAHLNCHFVNPIFNNSIVQESIWNGALFTLGIFSSGFWKSGIFSNGKFINSRGIVIERPYFSSINNLRLWIDGVFNLGEFYDSVWYGGVFNNGLFWNSDFYTGIWNNGILGSLDIPMSKTTFGHFEKSTDTLYYGATNAIWYNGTVNNALMGGDGIVYWYNGRYNSGEFTSYGSDPTKESIWFDGEFNGSQITNLARWKNGIFKRGKFHSYYGWDKVGPTSSSSKVASDYGWERGVFLDGEFGFGGLTANSVWFSGQFNNGNFKGRFWNDGLFVNGNFIGSATVSLTSSRTSYQGEYDFAYSFTKEYYGLWNDGVVLENESESQFEQFFGFNQNRAVDEQFTFPQETVFKNMLWLKGTFSHRNSIFKDSLFLSGNFFHAKFDGGIFNPYIDRSFTGNTSSLSFGNSAIWSSGNFLSGHFWASPWMKGNFYDGFISGANWNKGTFFYGTAENILWRDGTWKNGNWNGTPYNYTLISPTESQFYDEIADTFGTVSQYVMNTGREKEIIKKVSLYNTEDGGTPNPFLHLLNVFSASEPLTLTSDSFTNSRSWTSSRETYFALGERIVGYTSKGQPIRQLFPGQVSDKSSWLVFGSFELVRSTSPAGYLDANGQVSATVKPKFNNSTLKSTVTVRDANLRTFGGTYGYIPGTNLNGYNGSALPFVDTPPSRKIYMIRNGTKDVFNIPSTTYTIKLTLSVELREFVDVKVYVGLVGESTFKLRSDAYKYTEFRGSVTEQYEDYYPKIYTITSVYSTTAETISTEAGRQYWIEKPSFGVVRLLKCEITYQPIEYNLLYNNKLIESINLDANNGDGVIDFPTYSVTLSASSGNGKEVGLIFGNGVFKSGIWENGVWNNGYRSNSDFDGWNSAGSQTIKDDLVKATDIIATETYKISPTAWRVTLSVLSENISLLKINKKVSIGNIVGIDVNGNRRFFRDPISIISINSQLKKVVVRIVSNFDLTEVKRDSTDHFIYITHNIWLNGVFLNGFFRGVWNNGVFKGFPRLTEMNDTHFIDGVFDGGHFLSEQFYDDENRVFYNTSLIQNMTFNDKNVADFGGFLYQSWIDTPYSTQSRVNLNSDTNDYFVLFPLTTISSPRYRANLVGYPILDVLSSVSNFRDAESDFIQSYMLGTKRKRSINFLPSQGQFKSSVSNRIPQVGLSSFLLDGWTYSFFNGTFGEGTPNRLLWVESNTTTEDRKILKFSMTASTVNDTEYLQTILLLNNKNITTQPNRYYEVDLKLKEKIVGTESFLLLTPFDYNDTTVNSFNHAITDTLNKTEFFYNKYGLDLLYYNRGVFDGSPTSLKFDNISFYEVDMVPFIHYASASSIDQTIRPSYTGVAPKIDYNDNNFDFIDNVDLGIDFRVINLQNNTVKASTITKGQSTPIDYVIQNTAEIAETDISSGGSNNPITVVINPGLGGGGGA